MTKILTKTNIMIVLIIIEVREIEIVVIVVVLVFCYYYYYYENQIMNYDKNKRTVIEHIWNFQLRMVFQRTVSM